MSVKRLYFAGMQSALLLRRIVFFACVVCAAAFLLFLIDDNLGLGWPTNVIRNWQEYGFRNLHGKLICNPGGFDVAAHPDVYKGMSPVCFYPVYAAVKIFSWTGLDALSFHILLLAAMVWGLWRLLGRDEFAVIVAAAAILCPGYMRSLKVLDPNTLSILPVIPYAAIALWILRKPKLTPALAAGLLVVTLAYMSLNWTTAWVCGPCLFFLLGMQGVNRRGWIFLFIVMAVAVPLIVAASVLAKSGGGGATHTGSGGAARLIPSYLWGNVGYGEGLTTARAFTRLAFYNGIGLFPLWVIFLYVTVRRVQKKDALSWIMFAPLALALADPLVMRNYFGHHPPMTGGVLLSGLVFSIALLRMPPQAEPDKIRFGRPLAGALLCLAYGMVFIIFFRANEANMLSLGKLINQCTPRSDTIIIVKQTDPEMTAMTERLQEPMDRHIVVVDDFQGLGAETNHWAILSSVKLDGSFSLQGQSTAQSGSILNKTADWFNRSIAHRAPGDRLPLADTYYIYGPAH